MVSSRVAAAALGQAGLFACGVGLVLALQARFEAVATVLALVGLWLAAVAASRGRLAPALPAETPREQAEEAAHAQLLASLLDQTPAPLVTADAQGVLRARNRAARALFGADDRILDPPVALVEALGTEAPGRITAAVGEGDAQRTYVVSLSDVQAAEGPLRLAVLLDIEAEVRAAEAAALRDLMQVLGHEIMNGLTPIASLAATVQELLANPDAAGLAPAREALAVLARRAEGLMRFAESYRALARLPPPTLAPASVAGVIEEAARLFRSRWSGADVTLLATPPTPDADVAMDRDQIMHALLNLLANAAEAALAAPAPARVELSARRTEAGLALRVADSGEGVAAAARAQVFQPFFTTKAQGSGVGLSLGRQIARAHGGELDLQPGEPGGGAVFELRLGA